MHKFVTIAAAGAIALVASLSATAQSQAFFPALGLLGLAAAGATVAAADAAASDRWYHDGYFGGYGWDSHVAACEDAYRSYDFRTDTYVRRINGHLTRVYCEL
ncbi:MAG: BA14K family protein [Devosia sp.]|nr:BA14K family protein [Devosia sp.]